MTFQTALLLSSFGLSLLTIWATILAGNKDSRAWPVGMINQALWFTWSILAEQWGLILLPPALCIISFRNYLKWKKNP